MEAEFEETHPGGPLRQGSTARVSSLRHELQAHQPPEQARHPVSAHPVRRRPFVLGVHVVHVQRAAHTQTAAAVPGRVAHHLRVHVHRLDVVALSDDTGVAPEKPEFGPKLEF